MAEPGVVDLSTVAVRAVAQPEAPARPWELYKGWIVGAIIIVVILAVAFGFWFHFHP